MSKNLLFNTEFCFKLSLIAFFSFFSTTSFRAYARIAEIILAKTLLHQTMICPPNSGGKISINISIKTGSINVRTYEKAVFSVA